MSDDFHGALAIGAIVCFFLVQEEVLERRRVLLARACRAAWRRG
jgi:hypothetical protein